MPMAEERSANRTIRGWVIAVLLEAGAIRECEEHGWMRERGDPHAREHALDIASKIRHLDYRRRQRPEQSQKFSTRLGIPVLSAHQSELVAAPQLRLLEAI